MYAKHLAMIPIATSGGATRLIIDFKKEGNASTDGMDECRLDVYSLFSQFDGATNQYIHKDRAFYNNLVAMSMCSLSQNQKSQLREMNRY